MKFIIIFLFFSNISFAKLNVVTTIPDLKEIVKSIGGVYVNVDSIARGTQDPHYLEAKPSFMLNASKADLLVSIGLDLEVGWLPSIIKGSRNPNINPGKNGYLEIGELLNPLEIPNTKVTRADGDVHPLGNPHVYLDPTRIAKAAKLIASKLSELDSSHSAEFNKNANEFEKKINEKTDQWKVRIKNSGVKKIITYHKTLTYFLDRFGIINSGILEPKPGIPPTSSHIIQIIELMKKENINLILVENYFDPTVTKKIKDVLPNIRVEIVPVAVEGAAGINTNTDLFDALVRSIEGK